MYREEDVEKFITNRRVLIADPTDVANQKPATERRSRRTTRLEK
jgi:hypothetical protein